MKIDRRDSVDSRGNVVLSRPTLRSPYRIDRAHIIALLAERARAVGVEIQFNQPVKSARRDGTVTLADGRQHQADLIVVADGINSSIRDDLGLLRHRVWGRDCGVRVTIPRTSEEIGADEVHGTVMIEAWADRRRVIYCPVTKKEFYVLLTCTARDTAACRTPIEPAVWAESFPWMRNLLERIRKDADWSRTRWDRFQTIRLKRWSVGRVAVLGDAAHAMPPYLAQGAGHAMMNAVGLAASLERAESLGEALEQWEARERPLTEHTQLWTRIYGTTMFLPKALKKLSIQIEKHPWVAEQYLKTANHVPTGCRLPASASL
jgi:2-polyprenyl-6-methoxyphenol hydroxylase-like FAD-dependent oxidoreductase